MGNFLFTFNAVAPVFCVIFVGFLLRKMGLVSESFASASSRLVFNICLPLLIFLKLYQADIQNVINFKQIGFCYLGTFLFFLISWALSCFVVPQREDRGVFAQGSFRGNYAIVGIPLMMNIFGDVGLVNSAILLTAIIPINNILSIVALELPTCSNNLLSLFNARLVRILKSILTNPLIISTVTAVIFSYFQIPLPIFLIKTGAYLGSITIPLALISIGSALHFEAIKESSGIVMISTAIKLILMPIMLCFFALFVGFKGVDFSAIFFLFSAPTAISSYIMAEGMNMNGKLAAAIVVATTVFSVISISVGIFVLKSLAFL